MNSITIYLLIIPVVTAAPLNFGAEHNNVKRLNYQDSVREIVQDLITNWNSPLGYLKNRGYLKAPQMGLDMMLEKQVQDSKDQAKGKRVVRSNENDNSNELSQLFRTLFSNTDNNASDKIKSKLGVHWDMNALKTAVHNEAFKLYEKFYDSNNSHETKVTQGDDETDIEKEVAQLYPSVIYTFGKQPADERMKKLLTDVVAHKEPQLVSGIAKLLSNRPKPMTEKLKS